MEFSGIKQAVADAVALVNRNSGQASVKLSFLSSETPDIDFVANSGAMQDDGTFIFTSGFETFDGSVGELSDIDTQLIGR